jgi:hypothetical protein
MTHALNGYLFHVFDTTVNRENPQSANLPYKKELINVLTIAVFLDQLKTPIHYMEPANTTSVV